MVNIELINKLNEAEAGGGYKGRKPISTLIMCTEHLDCLKNCITNTNNVQYNCKTDI